VYLAGEASTRAWGSRHIVLKLDPLPRHSDLYAVYLHLARIEIPVDRRVRQGQRIGWAEIDGALLGGSRCLPSPTPRRWIVSSPCVGGLEISVHTGTMFLRVSRRTGEVARAQGKRI
jgi:hypothetical protein